MWQVYTFAAVVGGTLLACQLVLTLVGIGADHPEVAGGHGGDVGHATGTGPHAWGWLLGFLTFRSVVAGLTFFGLTGMTTAQFGGAVSLGVSAGAGLVAVLVVGAVMRMLMGLSGDGTARIEGAVGKAGTVYVPVPARGTGLGKVMLSLQERTVEYQAVTFQGDLPTGTKVVVTNVVGPDTVEVAAAPECRRMVHAAVETVAGAE